jgi:Protein of unknown function (DUF1236)
MKNRILTAGLIVGALMLPVATHAQVISGTIVGAALGGPVGAVAGAMIGGLNVAAFNDYVAAHTYPSYYYAGNVTVGASVPAGVTYYRVPADYYAPAYYTVLNGHTVVVDPATGKILQVMN